MRSKVIAKAIIFNEAGQVLLLRRSRTDDRRPGEQDFPGGGVDPGEDLTAAVIREISEEAGLQVELGDIHLFYAANEIYPANQARGGENITRLLFWARLQQPDVKLSFEHDAFEWVAPDEVYKKFPHKVYGVGFEHGRTHQLFS